MKRIFYIIFLLICSYEISAQTENIRISMLIGEMLSWDLVEKGNYVNRNYENGLITIEGTPNKYHLRFRVCDIIFGDCSSDTIDAIYLYRVNSKLPSFPLYKNSFISIIKNSNDENVIIQMEDARKTIDGQWVFVKPILGLPDYYNKNKKKIELEEPDPECKYGVYALEVVPVLVEKIEELNDNIYR